MDKPEIIVELLSAYARMPVFAHDTDACADLSTPTEFHIKPGETVKHPIGVAVQIPKGWEAQVRGRSGLAALGLDVHYGTIDHLYRSEIHVIMRNESNRLLSFNVGDRIAQIAFQRSPEVKLVQGRVEQTGRGGLGSTGLKAFQ